MPTLIESFVDSELTVRYRTPQGSAAINAKHAVSVAPGTYRGFRLATHASDNTITVVADPAATDHVAVYLNQTSGGSLTVRRTGGDFAIDLASLVDAGEKTWIIAIYAPYQVGFTTTGVVRAYELDPSDEFTIAAEKGDLVVLGKVVIPAGSAAPIPSGNITHDERTFAWSAKAAEALQWAPMLRNGGFEWSQEGSTFKHASAFWERAVSVGTATWATNTSDPNTGARALEFNLTSGPVTGDVAQHVNVPVYVGQLIKFKGYKKNLAASTGGAAEFFLEFLDVAGTGVVDVVIALSTAGVDASYVEIDTVIAVPAGASALARVGVRAVALDYGAGGVKLQIDDMQCWLEVGSALTSDLFEQRSGPGQVTDLVLLDPTDLAFAGSLAALLKFDAATGANGTLSVLNRDPANPGPAVAATDLEVSKQTTLGSDLLGSLVNADAARISAATSVFAGVEYTLMWESIPAAGKGYRKYSKADGTWVETYNCAWDNTANTWTKDVNGQDATKIESNALGQTFYLQTSLNTFDDTINIGGWGDGAANQEGLRLQPTVSGGRHALLATTTGASDAIIDAHSLGLSASAEFPGSLKNISGYETLDWVPVVNINGSPATINASACSFVFLGNKMVFIVVSVDYESNSTSAGFAGIDISGPSGMQMAPVVGLEKMFATHGRNVSSNDGAVVGAYWGYNNSSNKFELYDQNGDTAVWDVTTGVSYSATFSMLWLNEF